MNRYSETCRIMATLVTGYSILNNTRQVRLKRLRMTYDASWWHILHNMASTGPVWPVVGNGGQQWSWISSLNALVHFKAELRDLGTIYQVIACTALWLVKFDIKWLIMVQYLLQYRDMIDKCHVHHCITIFEQFWHFTSSLIILLSRCQVSAKVASNGS